MAKLERFIARTTQYLNSLPEKDRVALYGQAVFLWQDRSLFNLGASAKGLWWMFGVGKQAGYFRKSLPDYLAFFRRDFHPVQDDNSALLDRSRPMLERLLGRL